MNTENTSSGALRKIIYIIAAVVLAAIVFAVWRANTPPAPAAKPETNLPIASWTCPMHPEIHLPAAGKCPKCGMNLIPEKKP
jgi:hypothetical protein